MVRKGCIFCSSFFDYEHDIYNEINKNFDCKLFNSEPKFTLFDKFYNKLFKFHLKNKTFKYVKNIIDNLNEIEFIVIIFSPYFSKRIIEYIRGKFPKVKIINYLWDSVENFPSLLEISNSCDITYSFDKSDCIKYSYYFLPLFFPNININHEENEYDFCLIYSLYPKKIENHNLINSFLPKKANIFKHIFVKKIYFYYFKLFYKEFRKIKKKDIVFTSLSKNNVYSVFNKSKVIVDCPLTGQSGLTIRIFEALKLNKKIITTNSSIKEYDFYNENNILVIQDYQTFPDKFLESNFVDMKKEIEKYSLTSFLDSLLKSLY